MMKLSLYNVLHSVVVHHIPSIGWFLQAVPVCQEVLSCSVNDAGTISTLTFTAFEEDSGEYGCQIEGNSEDPATTTLTVGNVFFYTLFAGYDEFISSLQFQQYRLDQWM